MTVDNHLYSESNAQFSNWMSSLPRATSGRGEQESTEKLWLDEGGGKAQDDVEILWRDEGGGKAQDDAEVLWRDEYKPADSPSS